MEKPAALLLDRFDRYRAPRVKERMISRGIPILRDTDEEADKPLWRGDHAFSSDAASYSLMNFIEPEVAREHKDWDTTKVKAEALDRFTKRLAQDLSYERQEAHHEESVVRWKPIETSPGVFELATEYGDGMITLKELWVHTKEYAEFVGNPSAYNAEEARAQFAMQDAFIRGSATGFVSVLSHPDSVRYVQVWEKDFDGEIISKHVDLFAATGRDFSRVEGEQLIEHLSRYHHKTRVDSYASLFVEQGTVNEQSIRFIATGLVMSTERAPLYSIPVVKDVSDSMMLMGKFLHEEISEKIQELTAENGQKKTKKKIVTENKSTHTSTPKQEHRIEKMEVNKAIAEWTISQTIVNHSLDIPVAPHAALYWFSSLEYQRVPTQVEDIDKEKRIPEMSRVKPVRVNPVRHFWTAVVDRLKKIAQPKSIERGKNIHLSLKEKPVVQTKIIDTVRIFLQKTREHVSRLFYIVPMVSKPRKFEIVGEVPEPIREVQIALIFLKIFSNEKPKDSKRLIPISVRKDVDPQDAQESYVPIWVLLAIIRYLVLLKESGMGNRVIQTLGIRPKRKAKGTVKFILAS